ncbi:hypothetical protein [Nocardioides sp. LHG3406-4]|uniref:hypothetical protein n=1 Tax=Nocardioides sp. LHG3406-4 TaxID=2804575 RepID=UPI003CF27AE6
MRRFPTFIIALAAVLAPVLGLPHAAHAGGPTSVLLTRPGHDAAALYYSDSRYAELELLVADTTEVVPPPAFGEGGQQYNVTWLIHDQLIWRTDRIHVDGRQVYLETTMVDGVMDPGAEQTTTWHRAASGGQLLGLLQGLLKGGGGAADAYSPDLSASSPAPAPAAVPPVRAAESEPAWFTLTGWAWALPGLALGAVAGLLAGRRRAAQREPRQVLVEREAVGA